MEYEADTFAANRITNGTALAPLNTWKLHGGLILGFQGGHIRIEVYRKGMNFRAVLHQVVPWDSGAGYVIGDQRRYVWQACDSVFDLAGYVDDDGECYDGWAWLDQIGRAFTDGYSIYNFGSL